MDFPERIQTEEQLDEFMTQPRAQLIEFIKTMEGPLLLLGASGKMGPTLAVLARRAAMQARVQLRTVAASRFSDDGTRGSLERQGIETIACELLDREALEKLPDAPNIIYLVGMKFGTGRNPSMTWAVNTLIPSHVAERFPHARIVALSTGNVYPFVKVVSGGAVEDDPLTPVGEYANAAVARERIFEYHAKQNGTPLVFARLNYAVDLRYGVLLDIAQKVWAGKDVDVSMGYLNCIWQGDANEFILRALGLAQSPPLPMNLTGTEILSVRQLALRFGDLLGKQARIVGTEADFALLSNAARACELLGKPATPIESVMRWTADWVKHGGRTLNKPTHFEVRDGKY
jgi:nucleoside-diphosphate-sugar epimerase